MNPELTETAPFKQNLTDRERMQFDSQYAMNRKNPRTALLLSLFFGVFGLDRLWIGDAVLGVLKFCTFGGLCLWALVDLFLITRAARRKNLVVAQQIHDGIVMLRGQGREPAA